MKKDKEGTSWEELVKKLSALQKADDITHKASKNDNEKILRERAKALAVEKSKKDTNEEYINIIEFELGHEKYAFETRFLNEVAGTKKIQDLPGTPDFIYGVINLRGKIVTVIDLKKFLNLNYVGFNDSSSIIIVDYNSIPVGVVADTINGIKNIKVSSIHKKSLRLQNIKEIFLRGISDETVIILDIVKLLDDNNIQINNRPL